jgi:hypothetical protein
VYLPAMLYWLRIVVGTLRSLLRTQRNLALENLVLRQQLAVFKAGLIESMVWVARVPSHRPARDRRALASARISVLLAVEESSLWAPNHRS